MCIINISSEQNPSGRNRISILSTKETVEAGRGAWEVLAELLVLLVLGVVVEVVAIALWVAVLVGEELQEGVQRASQELLREELLLLEV